MSEVKTVGIKQVKHLMGVLMSTEKEIAELIKNKEKYYYISYKKKVDEKGQPRLDENGNILYRQLNPSQGRLKTIQEIIRNRILLSIPMPENIKGGVKGYSNVANAKAHLGKKYKFKTDIKKYFPSISPERVYKMFLQNGFSSKCCTILTHLTTHNFELPQGTPTSTDIANRIFLPNDLLIIEYCRLYKIRYTRFVDDLVFSSSTDFRQQCVDLVSFVTNDGFKISCKKTMFRAGNMQITGIDTKNNVLDVMDFFKRLLDDTTIDPKITHGRRSYYKQVRKK